ncbi:MAG: hypothetical protein OQK98_06330 [Gammaproteobacteria bacterium]|nr:hypothetical protein [Gammaproteobacteria bacterium]
MDPIKAGIIVALVRLVALLISGLLAYFGYRLFFDVPYESSSGGTIETPGLTISLSRLAPGTFFAICSAGIIIASFTYPIKITPDAVMGSVSEVASNTTQQAIDRAMNEVSENNDSATSANKAHLSKALQQLTCVRYIYNFKQHEISAIDYARVALMYQMWDDGWGEFDQFESWALEARGDAPVRTVEEIFNRRDPRCTK